MLVLKKIKVTQNHNKNNLGIKIVRNQYTSFEKD